MAWPSRHLFWYVLSLYLEPSVEDTPSILFDSINSVSETRNIYSDCQMAINVPTTRLRLDHVIRISLNRKLKISQAEKISGLERKLFTRQNSPD